MVGRFFYGGHCRICYEIEKIGPDPEPRLAEAREEIIRNLMETDSALIHIAWLEVRQANFRLENEDREEFDRIFSAVEAFFHSEMRGGWLLPPLLIIHTQYVLLFLISVRYVVYKLPFSSSRLFQEGSNTKFS